MRRVRLSLLAIALAGACGFSAGVSAQQAASPQRDAGGYRAPTARLEHGRRIFVESSCHFCHGADLTGALMGAADLMHSPIVGADENGNVLGAIVTAGLPNLQTAMPGYPELTKAELSDLAAYVHYLRQQGKFKELTASTVTGDATAGKVYFNGAGKCASCHTEDSMRAAAKKYDRTALRAHVLLPAGPTPTEGDETPGNTAHRKFTENATPTDAANLSAYLETLR